MPATIWAAYQAVWAFDDGLATAGLATADLATLHDLRIAAKWLRYTLEFVRAPLEPEATALIRQMVALQDHLGDQHDQHVAAVLAREFATSATLTAAQVKSTIRFVAHLDKGVDGLGRTLGTAWRPIVASSYRRALGRAIARL
jgi:CHAD domain-containing protein